ncbi:hypothetical protein ACFP2F_16575 [Hymenobacter artigasi]|uniref:Uncharacterized protein n=1 Tax=Hymenobacter artigasi TaxID=2719616 RepID=A0ABX1HNR6_9BACT|nr:hypothetical protein [Hymenobacter artigasi]NKI91465.1 hypothetical protein [Hymenobacter artigasi]
MKVHLTRDSVANGDDPYSKELTVSNNASIIEILRVVLHAVFLASIGGGKATWIALSRIPVAVVAQQWAKAKMLTPIPPLSRLNFSGNVLSMHFDYRVQQDPDLVYEKYQRMHSGHPFR